MTRSRLWLCATLLLVASLGMTARADLASYFKRPEPAYKWELLSTKAVADGKIYDIHMVSQTWEGMNWEHHLQIFQPTDVRHPEFCGLLNTGGHGGSEDEQLGMQVAKRSGAIFAILFDIPNQPLFGGLTEDNIIAYTWNKFMETGDENWPLHFPMAKAVLKAMDTIQAVAKKENLTPITGFLVAGASKRGWTTWLVGASGDPRVKAIVPMVIDTLNLPAQIPHQLAAYGKPSDSVKAYTVAGMVEKLQTPRGKRLIALEDPYSYRNKLTMPKLLVFGTNDPYWSQDSLNLYWNDLKGPKWILYCPNAGHDLQAGVSRILNTVPAFLASVAGHSSWPTPKWKYVNTAHGADLTVTSDIPIKSARLFHVQAPTQDFRKFRWTSDEMQPKPGGGFTGHLDAPDEGYRAMYSEMTFDIDGRTFTLSTQIKILGTKKATQALETK